MKKNIALLNIISSILLQCFTIIYGFFIQKMVLTYFGSEINGLLSSISQLLSYISLIEGGLTAVIIAKLYSPLIMKNNDEISSIIHTGTMFFRKIGILFFVYSIILAIIIPYIYMKDGFSYIYIFSLTIILSLGLLIQYMMSLGLKCLLNADKKIYIVSITQMIIILLSLVFSYISIKIWPNIHLFKLLTGITYIIQPIMYKAFINKNYSLKKQKKVNLNLIKDRWNGFANNLAYFIHTSTDITILTFATNLVTVSVYSVYSLVTTGLKSLIGAINTGICASIGHLYAAGDFRELEKKFDIYEYLYLSIVFFLITIASLLITPFVILYVGNANLLNMYYQPIFGYLISFAIMLDLVKTPHINLAYAANKFKEITIPCFIEAAINIIVSILLVLNFKLIGVAIGTIIAMIYRIIFQVYFTKKIIQRKQIKFYKNLIIMTINFVVSIIICNFIYPIYITDITVASWINHAIIYIIINAILFIIVNFLFFRKQVKNILLYFKKIKEGKKC